MSEEKAQALPHNHDLFKEGVMTPSDVARLFQVHPKTVTIWADNGKLSFFRTVGGHRRYSEAQVLRMLKGEE